MYALANCQKLLAIAAVLIHAAASSAELPSDLQSTNPPAFREGARHFTISLGAGPGSPILGSTSHHDLALARFDFGWIFTPQVLTNSLSAGHFEVLAEAFSGAEFDPEVAYVTGVGPLIRYNFSSHTHFVPFIELGAGTSLTDIGEPDLSGIFQFHLQGGLGAHLFLSPRSALTFTYRFLHISNAGISAPNLGVNNHSFSLGFSRFF